MRAGVLGLLAFVVACAPAGLDGEDPPVATAEAGEPRFGWVGEPLAFPAGASSGVSLRWRFGDGAEAVVGETSGGWEVEHTYAAPGHYVADLTAFGAYGEQVVDTVAVTVTERPLATPPRAATSVTGWGGSVYAALTDFDQLAVVDATGGVSHWSACAAPRSVDADATGVYVACEDALIALDHAGDVIWRVDPGRGRRPFGLVRDGDVLRVTLQGTGELLTLDLAGREVERVFATPDARGLAVADGARWVSRWRSDDRSGALVRFSAAGRMDVPVLRAPGPDSDTDARGVPTLLTRLAVRPDGRALVVAGVKQNVERGLTRDGLPLTFETSVRADLRVLDPDTGVELGVARLDDRDQIAAAVFARRGDWLFTLAPGVQAIEVFDPWTLRLVGGWQGVGYGADGLWADPDRDELWVLAQDSRALVHLDVSRAWAPAELARLDLTPASGEVLPAEVLRGKQIFGFSGDPRMSGGGYLSCASCHPEGEDDGRTWDFTDRGEGLRQTISLRGGGDGPIHWSGNFDEVQDFEHDIRGPQGGRGFLTDAAFAGASPSLGAPKAGLSPELDALAAYVGAIEPPPPGPFRTDEGSLTAAATRGRALFEDPDVGCAGCHPSPRYTDSAWETPGVPRVHDVGTLTEASGRRLGGPLLGLDTPSLLGLWATAPYLHDGSAPTLRDVITTRNPGDAHGRTSHLTADDVDDLVAWLQQIEAEPD